MDNNNETINLTHEMLQSLISTAVIAATTALGQNVSYSSGSPLNKQYMKTHFYMITNISRKYQDGKQ